MKNFGNKVNNPCDSVTDTGYKNENTNNESNNVLGFKESYDTVDAANKCAKKI